MSRRVSPFSKEPPQNFPAPVQNNTQVKSKRVSPFLNEPSQSKPNQQNRPRQSEPVQNNQVNHSIRKVGQNNNAPKLPPAKTKIRTMDELERLFGGQ